MKAEQILMGSFFMGFFMFNQATGQPPRPDPVVTTERQTPLKLIEATLASVGKEKKFFRAYHLLSEYQRAGSQALYK